MRLFVAVWPTSQVIELVDRLPRPDSRAVRWTLPDQWHVTLRFLGEVADDDVTALTATLRSLGERFAPCDAHAGPCTTRLGRGPLVLPVAGLEDIAAAVFAATTRPDSLPEPRPFNGHITLARGRARRAVPAALAGDALQATWPVTALHLVRSHLGGERARYETIASAPLTG